MSVFGPPVREVYQVTMPSFFAPSYSTFSRSGLLYAARSAIDFGLLLCAELGIGAQSRISGVKTIKRINILQFFRIRMISRKACPELCRRGAETPSSEIGLSEFILVI